MNANSIANTAFSALQGAQAGIALTAQNVGGQTTVGFTKRRLETSISQVLSNGSPVLGSGVSVDGFGRDWSALLQQQRVQQAGITAYHGSIADGLARLDAQAADASIAMDVPVNDFFASLAGLGRNPADATALDVVKAAGTKLLAAAQQFKTGVETVQSDARSALAGSVRELNTIGHELALINRDIATSQSVGGAGPDPAVLDRRDSLLQRAGTLVGGNLGVNADGQAYVFIDGQPLVNGFSSADLEATPQSAAANAPIRLSMRFGAADAAMPGAHASIRASTLQGQLGGQLELAGDPSILLQPAGTPKPMLKEFTDLFAAASGETPADATELTQALATLGAFSAGRGTTRPADVDAALQHLAGHSNSADPATGANALQTGLLTGWRGFVSNLAAQVTVHRSINTASAAVEGRLNTEFQSQSGVNLDEEAANLLKYQQTYSAASRLLQANATMLDGLLAIVGR